MTEAKLDIAILNESPLFSRLGADDREMLALVMERKRLQPHESLFKEGDDGRSLSLVVEGEFAIGVGGENEVIVRPYEVIGEMSCLDPAPRSATVAARTEAEVWQLDRSTLEMLRDSAPAVYAGMLQALSRRVTDRLRATNRAIRAKHPERSCPGSLVEESDPSDEYGGRIDLRGLDCLADFSASEIALLTSVARLRRYADGAVLCSEGSPTNRCFIVAEGELEIRQRIGGRRCILASAQPGEMVGQASLIDGGPRSATLVARGRVVTVEIERETFERWASASASVAIRFQELVGVAAIRQLRLANERLQQIPNRVTPAQGLPAPSARDQAGDGFERLDTVKRFFHNTLIETGISVEELDELERVV